MRPLIHPIVFITLATAPALCLSCAADSATGERDAGAPLDSASTPSVEAGPREGDAGNALCDGETDCLIYPANCSANTFCRVDVAFDPRASLQGVWGSSSNDVWAVGSQGTILHYDGAHWTPVATNETETFHSVWGTGPNDVWFASSTSFMMHSEGAAADGGVNLDLYQPYYGVNVACAVNALWGSEEAGMWVRPRCDAWTGGGNTMHASSWDGDGGPQWTQEFGWLGGDRALFGFGATDLWGVGVDGFLVHRVGYGDNSVWAKINSFSWTQLSSIWGSGPNDIWIVGNQGTLRHWDGTIVQVVPTDPGLANSNFLGIWGTSARDLWIVGDDALIVHYDGTRFARGVVGALLGTRPTFQKIWVSDTTDDVWIAGDGILLGGKKGALQ